MYNNSYLGSSYSSPQYNTYGQNYGLYQNPQMTQRPMPMQPQPQDVPFNDIKFVTADEAKAYIVMPNTKVMLMDRDNSVFYIKSADGLGKSMLEAFKYTRLEDNASEMVSAEFDPKEFVRSSDLADILRKDDLKGFLTAEEGKNFVTKDDLKGIDEKLDQLQKQIKINEILKGDDKSGK